MLKVPSMLQKGAKRYQVCYKKVQKGTRYGAKRYLYFTSCCVAPPSPPPP